MVDAPDGPNQGYYRSGPLHADGTVSAWRPWGAVPDWYFWENQGAGVAVADLDGDGTPELVVMAVDNPPGQNGGYYTVGWRLAAGRPADGWGPWQAIPDWRFWENQGAAVTIAGLGPERMPHLVPIVVDNPPGQNDGWYRVLDVMTDLDMAAEMGVWRLLENTSQVNPVHAALLHTGSVLFFAGSGNDPDRHNAHQYATAVWHYPQPQYSRPATPVDLFCCGHAFLPDGRLLASGGTEQYDPFFGLRQAVVFDPHGGPADPVSPTGTAGAWTAEPDMAHGRWYPSLITLQDGRVLAVSGLDETSQLNVNPEIYTDGPGWAAPMPPSPANWPQYAHLFLLADGRIYYSGGQYGGNNGVRPSVWDLAANTALEVKGVLVDAGKRNQSASVLLPPAQGQRVMLMGGGPSDMHDQTGATGTTAICDLSDPDAAVVTAAPMAMRRMHLCATLLPDRTVLVNGGSMMEESDADAVFEAEIYHPDAGGGPGTWSMAARSRVARLYHSVALLMPDGKVVTSGSNPQRKTEELRIEVFWPPYLFAGDTRAPVHPGRHRDPLRRHPDRCRAGPRPDRLGVPDQARRHHPLHRRRAAARRPATPGGRPGPGQPAAAAGPSDRASRLVPAVRGRRRRRARRGLVGPPELSWMTLRRQGWCLDGSSAIRSDVLRADVADLVPQQPLSDAVVAAVVLPGLAGRRRGDVRRQADSARIERAVSLLEHGRGERRPPGKPGRPGR